MPLDLDFELRLAVFDHLHRLAAQGGGRIAGSRLSEGLVFRGERVPIWNRQKGIFRPRILCEFGAALSVQTSFNSPYDDRADEQGDRLVYRYRGTDPAHPDNAALRRAMELGRPLAYFVAVEPGLYEAVYPCYVVAERAADLAFELMADMPVAGVVRQSADPLANIGLKQYATRMVKQRLHQGRFRYAVLAAYRLQCAMCRLKQEPLLDAAHIIPDRDERGLPEVPNGLALCRIHHGAYDVGILGVDGDHRIHVRDDVLEQHDGPMLRHGLQELHGNLIHVPRLERLQPNREYLMERFEAFRAA